MRRLDICKLLVSSFLVFSAVYFTISNFEQTKTSTSLFINRFHNLPENDNGLKPLRKRYKETYLNINLQSFIEEKQYFDGDIVEYCISKARQLTGMLEQDYTNNFAVSAIRQCNVGNCFDFSRCRLSSNFRVYLYDPYTYMGFYNYQQNDTFLDLISSVFDRSTYSTQNASESCVFVVVTNSDSIQRSKMHSHYFSDNLPYWGSDGANHILLNFGTNENRDIFTDYSSRAILAHSSFDNINYRRDYDIIIPPFMDINTQDIWKHLPPLLPAHRHYLMSFSGFSPLLNRHLENTDKKPNELMDDIEGDILAVKSLKKMQYNAHNHRFHFQFSGNEHIDDDDINADNASYQDWNLYGTESERAEILIQSTFGLILSPVSDSAISTLSFQKRIYEALKYGAIPVILGNRIGLPFEDVLPWKYACIIQPKARVNDVYFLLTSISDADILEMRRQGRMIWEKHLSSAKNLLDTLILTITRRLGMAVAPIPDTPSENMLAGKEEKSEADTYIFARNFTQEYHYDPFHLYPTTPFDPIFPSGALYDGTQTIAAEDRGGSIKTFKRSLGENRPIEQFTAVVLTFKRKGVLRNTILGLKGLPHLHKVVIIWNSRKPPDDNTEWPDIGVPIVVLKTKENSLNNRFLPYDAIQTDAVLSIDDDVQLRHKEIIFGFSVWRENRERLVGFPSRHHDWDPHSSIWKYNANFSCEISLVLTGAAFFHKYYMYMYSYTQHSAIKNLVDQYMNCEDIAMNFLISHITRKPPIKVTSRSNFLCNSCRKALSQDAEHYAERDKCINFFVRVYGYMPLLYTQHRTDSVLLKSCIPGGKEKCYENV